MPHIYKHGGGGFTLLIEVLLEGQLMWNVPLLVILAGISVFYALILSYFTDIKLYHRQPLVFFLGMGLLFLVLGSPLAPISHLSFSLHMIQMSILYFVVPPILLRGIPGPLFQIIWKNTLPPKVSKWFLSPRLALIVFAVLFLMYHLPVVLNAFSKDHFIHNGYISFLFLLSFGMWRPIVSPDPKQRFSKGEKKRYAVLSGLLLMPACLLFVFNAVTDGITNPFLSQLTAHLCSPSQDISQYILPSLFNSKYDQAMAGFLMLGIHKMSLMVTSRMANEESKNLGDR